MRRLLVIVSTAAVFLLLAGCGLETRRGVDDGESSTDELDSQIIDTTPNNDTGTYCDEVDFGFDRIPAKIMFLIDRSGSMAHSKWTQVQGALDTMLTTYTQDEYQFGYHVFPSADDNCGISSEVLIDTAPGNQQAILEVHEDTVPNGMTPMFCAVHAFLGDGYAPLLKDEELASYLVVMSDGQNSCSPECIGGGFDIMLSDYERLAKDLLAKGIHTITIGFGISSGPLNILAANGGTIIKQAIAASDETSLHHAFENVLGIADSCKVAVDPDSIDGRSDYINFYLDDTVIPYDQGCLQKKGWTWTNDEHTEAEICEYFCARLHSGHPKVLSATFGCEVVLL